ncbi:MAG: HlyD family efflux transporter periplasmic adaptor subunit [Candidatus Moranbacteria bacterium]|nr:HlyD family efflux transporter periplasmic adaptor subunit [Candidatus Moranbacteria bacterium]
MFKYKKTIAAILILVIAGGYFFYARSKKPKIEYTTATVEKGSLSQTVSATGDLKDDSEIVLNFELGGRISKVFVKKGDKVATGESIAMLDNANLSGQVEQARATLDKAVADAGSNDDAVREAQVAVDNADSYLSDTKDLENQKVDAADKAYDNAKNYYDDALAFYNDTPTKTNKLTLTTAQNSKTAAAESLDTAKKSRDLSITSAENSVDAAKARLKTTESKFTINSGNALVDSAKAGYDIALNNLSKAVLKAPVSGTIVEVNNKVGEILGTGVIKESFARIIADDFIIESNIPESDIVKLKLGQKAKITFDALPTGDEFDAELIEINPAETVIQDVVYYGIKLKLAAVDQRLKVGMSANVDVRTNDKADVLMIPLRAIKITNGEKFVDILKADNTTEEVKITTGLEGDGGMVEAKSGVKEGDKVVTFSKNI